MECVPQLGELGLVDTFVPILVRLQQQKVKEKIFVGNVAIFVGGNIC